MYEFTDSVNSHVHFQRPDLCINPYFDHMGPPNVPAEKARTSVRDESWPLVRASHQSAMWNLAHDIQHHDSLDSEGNYLSIQC